MGGGGGDSSAEGYFDIGYSTRSSARSAEAAVALRCLQHMALLSLKPTARLAGARRPRRPCHILPLTRSSLPPSSLLSASPSLFSLPTKYCANGQSPNNVSPRNRSELGRERGRDLPLHRIVARRAGWSPSYSSAIPRPFIAQNRASQRIHNKHTIWARLYTVVSLRHSVDEEGESEALDAKLNLLSNVDIKA